MLRRFDFKILTINVCVECHRQVWLEKNPNCRNVWKAKCNVFFKCGMDDINTQAGSLKVKVMHAQHRCYG